MRALQTPALAFALVASVATLAPTEAHAVQWTIKDTNAKERPMNLDGMVSIYPAGWIGLGGWFAIPIVPEGFLPMLNDSFDVEVGAYMSFFWFYSSSFVGLTPLGGARWKFHLTPDWTAFVTAKMGWQIGFTSSVPGASVFRGGPSVGAYWHPDDTMWIRLEAGYPGGFAAGVGLLM